MSDVIDGLLEGPQNFADGVGRVWTISLVEPGMEEMAVALLGMARDRPDELAMRLSSPDAMLEFIPLIARHGKVWGSQDPREGSYGSLSDRLSERGGAMDAAAAVFNALLEIAAHGKDEAVRSGVLEALSLSPWESDLALHAGRLCRREVAEQMSERVAEKVSEGDLSLPAIEASAQAHRIRTDAHPNLITIPSVSVKFSFESGAP